MRKKLLLFLFLILVTLSTTGCWNLRNLNQMGIVAAIGIDKGTDANIKLSVQVIKPTDVKKGGAAQSGSRSSSAVWVITSTGDTVFDAILNLIKKSGRKLFYPHNYVIVLGEEMAREGVFPIIDWFNRDHEVRPLTWVLVTEGKAEDIIRGTSEMEKIPGEQIDRMVRDSGAVSQTVAINLLSFYCSLTETSSAVIGKIQKKTKDGLDEFILEGAGVFRADKLFSWLTPMESRGFLWVKDKVKSGIISVPCPENPNEFISLEVIKAHSKVTPTLKKGEISLQINIEVESNLSERMCSQDFEENDTFEKLEEEENEAIKDEIYRIIEKAQKDYKLDIFGFGVTLKQKLPHEWQTVKSEWDKIFPEVNVDVVVNSKIKRTGLLKD